jgi:enterochelin esterase-like enzyme
MERSQLSSGPMRYRVILCLLLVHAVLEGRAEAQCTNLPPGTANVAFPSVYMGGSWPLVVYLPPDYGTTSRRYPVVYWFHGRGDNQCTQVSLAVNIQAAIQSGAATPMIYVFLNGGAQCNFDDTSCPGMRSESYIMMELIPYIDSHYRTIANPLGKALEGFSMGAEGVLRYFYTYTDQFCDVMAYAPLARGGVPQAAQGKIKARGAVVMRLVVGTADAVHFAPCHAYDQMLTQLMLPHEYQEIPGVPHNPFALWGAMGNMVGDRGLALHTRCFAGALADADGGSTADAAPPNDAAVADVVGDDGSDAPPISPMADAGGDSTSVAEAGSAGALDGSASLGDSAAEADGAAAAEEPGRVASHGGCACTAGGRREFQLNVWAVLALPCAGLLASRRRARRVRRRRSRTSEPPAAKGR